MDTLACRSNPVLYDLLSNMRTISHDTVRDDDLRARDFFGSPLRNAPTNGRIGAYPVFPTYFPDRRRKDGKLLIKGWPLKKIPDGIPESWVIFLELLRCIAAPLENAEPPDYHQTGYLVPKFLPESYFYHNSISDDAEFAAHHSTALRYSILKSYTLILLRHLSCQNEAFASQILLKHDGALRCERFDQALIDVGSPSVWTDIIIKAGTFLLSKTYGDVFLQTPFTGSLQGLEQSGRQSGRLAGINRKVAGIEIKRLLNSSTATALPRTLSALLHLWRENFGSPNSEGGRPATMFTDTMAERLKDERQEGEPPKNVLSGKARLDWAKALLQTEAWESYEFSKNDKVRRSDGTSAKGDGVPSISAANWMCFCLVLEALIAGELQPILSTTASPASGHGFQSDACGGVVHNPSVAEESTHSPNRVKKEAAMRTGLILTIEGKTADAVARSRFAAAGRKEAPDWLPNNLSPIVDFQFQPADFQFQAASKYKIEATDGICFSPLSCPVEKDIDSDIPRGGIWLPLPRVSDLENSTGLDVEVLVYRYNGDSTADQDKLTLLDIGIVDEYRYKDGLLLALEPADWRNPELPAGYGRAEFDTVSIFGLVGTAEEPESMLIMIACVPRAPAADAA